MAGREGDGLVWSCEGVGICGELQGSTGRGAGQVDAGQQLGVQPEQGI